MKKTVIVVILAALILAALPVFTIPNAKASASEAKVLSYSYYTAGANSVLASKSGDLVIVGEVQNVGSGIINNVTVTGTAYDSNGTELGSAEGTVFVFEMTSGQKAPFSIDIPSLSSTNTNPYWASSVSRVTISVLSVTDTSTAPYTGLTVPQQPTSFNNSGTYETVGTIVNNGSETVGYLWVVTTFYNSAGTVVGLNFTDYLITPSAPLYQGHPTRWVATPADNTATLTNEIASSVYVIDTIPYSSSSQNKNTPTPTATGSSSPFPLLPVVVVVVIIVVAVVALMLLRKRPEAQPPPPPPPPPMP